MSKILGIYNYCDYWCDRCAFTRRCGTYSMKIEEEAELRKKIRDKGRPDEENAAFWNSIDGVLARTREQLDEITVSRFTDEAWGEYEEPDEAERASWQREQDVIAEKVRVHPLTQTASKYMGLVAKWLETAQPDVAAATEDMVARARVEFEGITGTARREFNELEEMIEVVLWYHTLLYPKTCRFVRDIVEDGPASGRAGEDTLGTAKLLLVSADRCIGAWLNLRQSLPSQEDNILRFLSMLDNLRRGIEKETPSARGYVRPGLDE